VRPLARVVCRGEQPAAATDCRHQAAQGHLTLSGGRTATAYVMSWRVPAIAVTPSHGNLRAARMFFLAARPQPQGYPVRRNATTRTSAERKVNINYEQNIDVLTVILEFFL
jgi:hypothetical protein